MKNVNKVPSKKLKFEISITLLEYLKRISVIEDGMYNFCINKLIHKLELVKDKIDDDYINDINNYKILT